MADVMEFPSTVEEFMEYYKVIDTDHVYSNGTEFVPIYRMRQWFDHLDAVPRTKADRIRAMSDEELADLFTCFGIFFCPVTGATCYKEPSCKDCFERWMKKEAK